MTHPDQFPNYKTVVKFFQGKQGDPIAIRFYEKKAPVPDTEDYKCTHCGEVIPEDDVPLLLWSDDGNDGAASRMAILHTECAMQAGLFSQIT